MNTSKLINALQVLGASAEVAKSIAKRIESATERTGDSSPSGHLRALAMSLNKLGSESRSPVTLACAIVIEALGEFARQAETQDRSEAKAKAEAKKAEADTPKAKKATPEALLMADLPKAPKTSRGRTKATQDDPAPVTITRKVASSELSTEAIMNEEKIARIVAQVIQAGQLADRT